MESGQMPAFVRAVEILIRCEVHVTHKYYVTGLLTNEIP